MEKYYIYKSVGVSVNPLLPSTKAKFNPPYVSGNSGIGKEYEIDCRENFNEAEQEMIKRYDIKMLENLLRCDEISSSDKERAMECYKYVCKRIRLMGIEPFNGNTTIQCGKYLFAIRISKDKEITFTQSCGIHSRKEYSVMSF
jgi:hypothetical protein